MRYGWALQGVWMRVTDRTSPAGRGTRRPTGAAFELSCAQPGVQPQPEPWRLRGPGVTLTVYSRRVVQRESYGIRTRDIRFDRAALLPTELKTQITGGYGRI